MKFNDLSLVEGGALAEGRVWGRVMGRALTTAAKDGEAPGHPGIIRDPFT